MTNIIAELGNAQKRDDVPEFRAGDTEAAEGIVQLAAALEPIVPHSQRRGMVDARLGLGVVASTAPEIVEAVSLQDVGAGGALQLGEVLPQEDFTLEQVVDVDLPRMHLADVTRDRVGPVAPQLEAPRYTARIIERFARRLES